MKKLLLITCIVFFAACSKSSSTSNNNTSFLGNWNGSYKGQRTNGAKDSGTIVLSILKDSSITGAINSTVYEEMKNKKVVGQFVYYSDGSGKVSLSIQGNGAAYFVSDNLLLKTGEIDGHWQYPIEGENESWSGQWEIHKK